MELNPLDEGEYAAGLVVSTTAAGQAKGYGIPSPAQIFVALRMLVEASNDDRLLRANCSVDLDLIQMQHRGPFDT